MSTKGVRPDFVVAGAMRSGTTSLHHWLRHHTSVFMPAVKEVHYFDLHYEQGPSWYERHFAGSAPGQVVGEATPEYLFLPWARERLCRDLPESRIVVTLRDPVERAWSHYCMLRARGREDLTFEQALDREPERLRDRASWSRYGYVAKGRYADQLADLFERHGREQVLVLLFERDLVARPGLAFERVCRFVGVDAAPPEATPHSSVVGTAVNAALEVRSVRVRRLSRRLPKPARDAVGRLNTRPRGNEPLPAALRARLQEELLPSTADLERLLGTELLEWAPRPADVAPGAG